MFESHLSIIMLLFVTAYKTKHYNFLWFFFGKIVTSLAYIFTMKKALVKIIFVRKLLICEPIFKIFVALFRTFGMQKDAKIIFQYKMICKRQYPKDGVRRVVR